MFQLIQELLTRTDKKHIFYFSFDEIVFDFKEILESYQQTVLANNFDVVDYRKGLVFVANMPDTKLVQQVRVRIQIRPKQNLIAVAR